MKKTDIIEWAEELYESNVKILKFNIIVFRDAIVPILQKNSRANAHISSKRQIGIDTIIEGKEVVVPMISADDITTQKLISISSFIKEPALNQLFDFNLIFQNKNCIEMVGICFIEMI